MANDPNKNYRMTVVAAAMVDQAARVLVQRRPPGKPMADLWEFPGGKVEDGETPEAALVRELHEELGIVADPAALVPASFASAPLGERHLVLLLYLLRDWSGTPAPRHATALRWVSLAEMAELAMPPADVPLFAALGRLLA